MARLVFINYHFHATLKKVQASDIDKFLGVYIFKTQLTRVQFHLCLSYLLEAL